MGRPCECKCGKEIEDGRDKRALYRFECAARRAYERQKVYEERKRILERIEALPLERLKVLEMVGI